MDSSDGDRISATNEAREPKIHGVWWIGTCFIFPYIEILSHIFSHIFRGVETTNQMVFDGLDMTWYDWMLEWWPPRLIKISEAVPADRQEITRMILLAVLKLMGCNFSTSLWYARSKSEGHLQCHKSKFCRTWGPILRNHSITMKDTVPVRVMKQLHSGFVKISPVYLYHPWGLQFIPILCGFPSRSRNQQDLH